VLILGQPFASFRAIAKTPITLLTPRIHHWTQILALTRSKFSASLFPRETIRKFAMFRIRQIADSPAHTNLSSGLPAVSS
jgi:hypothetical protein